MELLTSLATGLLLTSGVMAGGLLAAVAVIATASRISRQPAIPQPAR